MYNSTMESKSPPASLSSRIRSRLVVLLLGSAVLLELAYQWSAGLGGHAHGPMGRVLTRLLSPLVHRYVPGRAWIIEHPTATALAALAAAIAVALLARGTLLVWHNHVLARLSGTYFEPAPTSFPVVPVDLMAEIGRRPPHRTFVGLRPRRRFLRASGEPVYLDERQRSTHTHIIGKTGSGKTQSVIWPQAFQDILDGRGVAILSGKGSDEEIRTIKALALIAHRANDLRVFALPAWNRPELPTHTYNMVYVEPRRPGSSGGDPVATAERVFKVLPMGDNVFYNQQAQIMFRNLCRALHGLVDEHGIGIPFAMRDVAVCLKGVGNRNHTYRGALELVLRTTLDREASAEIRSQIDRIGHEIHKVLSGLVGAVDQFLAPMVNSYEPDIVLEHVLEQKQILYVQLPSNLYKIQAPALGKVFLQDIQQEGSLRQVYRGSRSQVPFSVIIDEFARFADLSIVDSLNQLRDARIQFTIAHQSLADLELVSREFATSVWDNTRVKIVLNQDNPELCEMVAKSIGTQNEVLLTVRKDPGPLFTSLQTGVASSRQVESYKLHPNRIKNLAAAGQAYLYTDASIEPLCLGQLPELHAEYQLPTRATTKTRGLRLYERVSRASAEAEARLDRSSTSFERSTADA
jgi:intracellular multiplication protein IcmO